MFADRPAPAGVTIPAIGGLLESALYVDDIDRASTFFSEVLGMSPMLSTDRLVALDAGVGVVLLLFARGQSRADMMDSRGTVPGHDAAGPAHLAFAIAEADYQPWMDRLIAHDVRLRGEMRWDGGARSLYFEDPDGHVLEFATPGLWPNDVRR